MRYGGVGTAMAGSGNDEERDPGNHSDIFGGTEQSNTESRDCCVRKPTRPAPVTATEKEIACKDFLVQSAPSSSISAPDDDTQKAEYHLYI
jgi:hypothetical protein